MAEHLGAAALAARLEGAGIPGPEAERLARGVAAQPGPLEAWSAAAALLRPQHPFAAHRALHDAVFARWDAERRGPPPVWVPPPGAWAASNLGRFAASLGHGDLESLWRWSVDDRAGFWREVVARLEVPFRRRAERVLRPLDGPPHWRWFEGAELSAVDACLRGDPQRPAIRERREDGRERSLCLGELDELARRVRATLEALGHRPGDAIAVAMPMTVEAVAAYLGIVAAGCTVVSIADSFAPPEIATRLRIAGARRVVTADRVLRGGRTLPMLEKVRQAGARESIVVGDALRLEPGEVPWTRVLRTDPHPEPPLATPPDHPTNILFSSGTTGDPKAIPWTQLTPIKSAMDGHFHHDIRSGDVVAWPTNLGWMMGPWLIYASLVNGAGMALFDGAPHGPSFCRFVQDAGVTMLGVVPALVRAWRRGGATAGVDWSAIRAFSSTGEVSRPDDMHWLMSRAGYRPVIEYCGGTEIGGGYITGTVVQPAVPSAFTTPALGLDFRILDAEGREARMGELFIVPPSVGLSERLLNRDHEAVYLAGTPPDPRTGGPLRRHGDEVEALPGGLWRAHGRADDTMNLGGIKVSSAEIERVLNRLPGIVETAAVAVPPPGGGPSRLVVFAVPQAGAPASPDTLRAAMQERIREELNPLFKLAGVELVETLPRTASGKVMRRVLRARIRGA